MGSINKILSRVSNKSDGLHRKLLDKLFGQSRKISHNNISMQFFIPNALNKYRVKNFSDLSRLIIESKIIMARPVVFYFGDNNVDIFHG